MRIVITGATGNVGAALLRALTAHGDHELVGLARRVPAPDAALRGRVTWVGTDLTDPTDQTLLEETFRGADAVVHLAWGFQPSHDPDYLAELGVGGTRRVLDAVAASAVPHLVHMSSVGAYSPKRDDRPVDETYPTSGVPSSPYSQHKAHAERLLDTFAEDHRDVTLTRMRPGLIGQSSAGSALLRYTLPALLPSRLLRLVPVLPLDRALRIPMVHADDVADAFTRALSSGTGGAFNLAADPPVTVDDIARTLGARHIQVSRRVVRAVVAGSWRAHLQQLDPGWIDLAYDVPLLASDKATRELGWTPTHDGPSVLADIVEGMASAEHAKTAVLRPRTVLDGLRSAVRGGPVAHRRRP
jgi:UDP-glucose 4-epimerase